MDIYSNPISGFPPKDCGNDGSKSKNSFSKTTIMLNSYAYFNNERYGTVTCKKLYLYSV
jgi:hypothetical protein